MRTWIALGLLAFSACGSGTEAAAIPCAVSAAQFATGAPGSTTVWACLPYSNGQIGQYWSLYSDGTACNALFSSTGASLGSSCSLTWSMPSCGVLEVLAGSQASGLNGSRWRGLVLTSPTSLNLTFDAYLAGSLAASLAGTCDKI